MNTNDSYVTFEVRCPDCGCEVKPSAFDGRGDLRAFMMTGFCPDCILQRWEDSQNQQIEVSQ